MSTDIIVKQISGENDAMTLKEIIINKVKNARYGRRLKAGLLAIFMLFNAVAPDAAAKTVYASTLGPIGTQIPHLGEPGHSYMDSTFQCIDAFADLGPNGGYEHDMDSYVRVLPSSTLSNSEEGLLFWSLFFMFGVIPQDRDSLYPDMDFNGIRDVYAKLQSAGFPIEGVVFSDFNRILHNATVRARYPLCQKLANDNAEAEKYLKAMGLIGGTGGGSSTPGVGGKSVPTVFTDHISVGTALDISGSLSIDTGDEEFLKTVKIEFSGDGGASFSTTPVNDISYAIDGSVITFTCQNPEVPKTYIRFNTEGTAYASAGGGGYASPFDVYEECLEIWAMQDCTGGKAGTILPSSMHQRFASLNMVPGAGGVPFAMLGKTKGEGGDGKLTFTSYKHTEDWTSHYNVQLNKYDYETGKPLKDSTFYLYERFDDKDQINQSNDGAVELYEGGSDYASRYDDNPVTWDDFIYIAGLTTDDNGHVEYQRQHQYHYEKSFCDGHPAPEFVEVPEEEFDENGNLLNEAEIEEAQQTNMDLAEGWINTLSDCESYASSMDGVHFHWVMGSVDQGTIEEVAGSGGDPGDCPDAGTTESADGDTAYESSGCKADCEDTYDKFIALKYSYVWDEIKARTGYTLHDNHTDDIPIEVIRTDSSENGANSTFAGEYFKDITVNDGAAPMLTMGPPVMLKTLKAMHAIQPAAEAEEEPVTEKKTVSILGFFRDALEGLFGEKKATPSDAKKTPDGDELIDGIVPSAEGSSKKGSSDTDPEDLISEDETGSEKETETKEKETTAEESPAAVSDGTPEDPVSVVDVEEIEEITENDKAGTTETEAPDVVSDSDAAVPAVVEGADEIGEVSVIGRILQGAKRLLSEVGDFFAMTAYAAEGPGPDSIYDEGFDEGGWNTKGGQEAGAKVTVGPDDNRSHCNDTDGEGNAWRVYDHRTEGELHINKRDFDLSDSAKTAFDDYAKNNADGTLEGAVYGLFAADNIVHPDGKTGIVYATNDLVAVATTDRDGNASFMVNTVTPDSTYNYETGSVERRNERTIPTNLYDHEHSDDDYTVDGKYTRDYPDLTTLNGNEWIGRPLLLGSYYIKELSRSEGYELSIGNKDKYISNYGQDPDVKVGGSSSAAGTVEVTRNPMYDVQIKADRTGITSPDPDWPYYDEIFFEVTSRGTGTQGYDLKMGAFPAGTKIYRKENSKKTVEVIVGTGEYEEVFETDGAGNKIEVTAGDHEYIKYDGSGNPVTVITYPDMKVKDVPFYAQKPIDDAKRDAALAEAEKGMDEAAVALKLTEGFSPADELFVKAKVEKALRVNGRSTPKDDTGYSTVTTGIYNDGTGATYGKAVQKLIISGAPLANGDLIASIVDFYNACGYYNFGGVKSISETLGTYTVEVYAGTVADGATFVTEIGGEKAFFAPVVHESTDLSEKRYVYAVYTETGSSPLSDGTTVFGAYMNYTESGSKASATLHTKAAAVDPASYDLSTFELKETGFYPAGTKPVYDASGNIIYKKKWVQKTETKTYVTPALVWKEIASTTGADEIIHVDSDYTDGQGTHHDDGSGETISFLAVVPCAAADKHVTVTAGDVAKMGAANVLGYKTGDSIPVAEYYVLSKKVYVKPYADSTAILSLLGAGSYVKTAELVYPGQDAVDTSAGTVEVPINVYERPIRQAVKVGKDIWLDADENSDNTGDSYRNNTYDVTEVSKLTNFRFKAYLKSNLERLYRQADGTITWTDENGNVMTPVLTGGVLTWTVDGASYDWPEIDKMDGTKIDSLNVQPIYTVVSHETGSKTAGRIANNVFNEYKTPAGNTSDVAALSPFTTALRPSAAEAIITNAALYSYVGKNIDKQVSDKLRDQANAGYTRILETIDVGIEDGAGMRTVQQYNYEKFFDAIAVANGDKWDDNAPSYTLYKPIGNKNNRKARQVSNASRSDRVVQFAIDWYLQDEVGKLTSAVAASVVAGAKTEDEAKAALTANNYQADLYDEALEKAIAKAENYLKPFFQYDLDAIYSLQWDSDENGGTDKDTTTLTADTDNAFETCGVSAYLPYGDYVIVEQQPQYVGTDAAAYNDFLNKHYKKDKAKEVKIPSVYEGNDPGNTADNYAKKYEYAYSETNEHWASEDFLIRFGEEWNQNETGTFQHAIRAHSYYGDFEVYPYGLDIDKLPGSVNSGSYLGWSVTQDETEPLKDYYGLTHFGESIDGARVEITAKEGGNASSKWNISSLNAGKEPTHNETPHYDSESLVQRIAYASISEDDGTADHVLRKDGTVTEDNASGMAWYDGVNSVTGILTANDKNYAQMLVPYTLTRSAAGDTYAAAMFVGNADVNVRNRFYSAKLRLEKLDSETHENILHDGAAFQVYKAKRDETTGVVMIYSADTDITGSREFITAYCMKDTVMPVDPENPRGQYQGTVAAGTPVCFEEDMVTLGDRYGHEVGEFEAFSTKVDVAAKDEMTDVQTTPANYIEQDAGYIEFPQPLGAGVYVLVETVVPSGYVRTKPVAVEIYSDKVTYYKEGNKNDRVIAAIFEEEEIRKTDADGSGIGTDEEATNNKNKPQDTVDVARVFIEDAPIKLTLEKVKESSVSSADTTADKTVTYKVSGRVEGKMAAVGGRDDLEYAYLAGKYQGYAYYKGTLEYLAQLRKIYEDDGDPLTSVEIIYEDTLFTGYAYVKRPLETSDDDNKYVTGAKFTLVDAIQLRRNPAYGFGSSDYGDYAFTFPDAEDKKHGLIVERNDTTSNVTRMYVEQGYAGAKTIYKIETDAAGNPITTSTLTGYTKDGKPVYTEGYRYISETIERPDTDILFYDLDSLEVVFDETEDGVTRHYGYDFNKNRVELALLEHDKHNFETTDKEYSIYAFKGSVPVYEFVGGDFNHISYNAAGKYLKVDPETVVYHLDEDGNRDSMVDPKTGMAYVIEKAVGPDGTIHDKFLVWATEVWKDSYGNVIARDKITTSRVGTIGENDASMLDVLTGIPSAKDPAGGNSAVASAGSFEHKESGSVSGMWKSDDGEESHHETSDRMNRFNQNMNGEMLLSDNNGDFLKQYSPIYDESGNILYYQRSAETYDKGSSLYDRDGDFVRYDNSDILKEYDDAAYDKNRYPLLYDADQKAEDPDTKALYHRKGEGYVLENTWITSDKTPNDPFEFTLTDGQADVIKRVPEGTYIIEETFVPNGGTNGAYVRAFPVGITVNETTDAQMAKVVEKTTKIEIAKIDGTNRYTIDVLAMDDGARDIGDEVNEKTSYSNGLIGGATLALYKAEKKYTSDYITYPKGYCLVKSETTPLKYHPTNWKVSDPVELIAQWTTVKDELIYLEGIPQGFYILEEISVPEGFLKAAPIEVEIGASMEVQEIPVNDDHTKVEVEKVCHAGGPMKQLRGAKMELHEAEVDGTGAVQLDANGNPKYKEAKLLTWVTSDKDEFRKLPAAFEEMFSAHGINGSGFEYVDDKGNTHTLTRTSIDYSYDWALAGGTALQYPTDARLIFTDEAGRRTRISVFQQKQSGLKITYSYDYEFDWTDITAVNEYCDSYITINGVRRFNYLPIGKKYVVVEAEAPAGFAKAPPKIVTAEDTPEAQRYIIEDTEARLIISKVLTGKTKEVPGITLSLYRAEAGVFVKDAAHLVETWKTGEDGTYNADDALFGRMPAGYAKGDLRAHEITGIPAGTYYLYEENALPYYERFEPVKIEYTDLSEVKFVRTENAPAVGEVTLYKKDPAGNYLTGAVYEVKRYKAEDLTVPVETLTYTDTTGTLVISGLSVGEVSGTGEVKPYTYTIREIRAPEGYSVADTLFTFRFDPKAEDGESYDFGDFAKKEYEVFDRKTKFRFQKKDFDSLCDDDTDQAFVDGAAIILYELTGIDVNGNPEYDTAHPVKTITTSRIEKTAEIEGLIAGKSYVFVEAYWPVGWNLMKPVMFTVSADGRKITELTNRLSAITFIPVKDTDFPTDTENLDRDSIAAAIIHGRFVTKVEYEIIDAAGAMKESWPADGIHVVSQASGYTQEESYTLLEKTTYSDGTMQITDRLTKPFIFDETGTMKFETRSAEKVELGAYYSDGTLIDELNPVTDTEFEKTIANSVMTENPVITTSQIGYDEGTPIDQTKLIYDRIAFVNPTHKAADAVVTVEINDDTRIVDIAGGTASGNTLTWTVAGIPAFGSVIIDFVTAHEYVNFDAHELKVKAEIAGKTLEAERAVPVIKKNCLTLCNSLTGSGAKVYVNEEEEYTVRLWYNLTGKELAGTYSYTGSRTGTMTSGDKITLKANEYVIIDTGSYEDVHYTVERTENGRTVTDKGMDGDFTEVLGAYAFSHRAVIDTSVRDLFRKGEEYHLIERTTYSDGVAVTTNRLGFAVGENGQADMVIAFDTRTKVAISKTDITDGHEIPGCTLTLYDANGTSEDTTDDNLIEQWVSNDKPHMFEGVLESGKTYRLEETSAAPGYAYTEDVLFEVDSEGTIIQKVKMVDKPTDVTINKSNFTTGEPVEGAKLQIIDAGGNIIKEWVTDADGSERFVCVLNADETYTLHEEYSPDGYYYSHDEEFTVAHDGTPQVTEMKNHEIVVVTPPEEPEQPVEPHPDYEMEKERTSLAPIKTGTVQHGFYRGDTVYYDVTIVNTGNMDLRMKVTDSYEQPEFFTEPVIDKITFHSSKTTLATPSFGRTHSISGSVGDISIFTGGYAVVTYKAVVKDDTPENLSDRAKDDGMGYLNTARTYDVVGRYIEEGTNTEKTVDRDDFPELEDKEDDANTPVQETEEISYPRYVMEKERITPAPKKEGTERYGFFRGDTVRYEVRVTNTGIMPLKIYVSDEFEGTTAKYFRDLHIEKISFEGAGSDISGAGYGVGTEKARIRIEPGVKAVLTYSAVVSDDAPEFLSFTAPDDGVGYLNIARTYDVKAEKPDGSAGDKHEYPSIPDLEDEGNTPVQEPGKPDDEHPRPYPIIWLLKEGEGDPGIMLQGGTFVLLDADRNPLTGPCAIEEFAMRDFWQEWDIVLKADATYYMHEVEPPKGFAHAEDVSFSVDHYGEDRRVVMIDKPTKVEITKTDITGTEEVPGCELLLRDKDGHPVDSWISGETPHTMEGKLKAGEEYTLVEVNPAPGYAYAEDITFEVSNDGTIDKIVMKDEVTRVEISKTDITGEREIPGARLIIYDADGSKVEEWTSGAEPHVIEGKLIAGGSYVLHEEGTPDGYAYTSDIVFAVSKDGRIDKVVMKDEATDIEVKKQSEGGILLSGAVLAVLDKDGKEVIRWTTDGTPKELKAVLNADTEYTLREISAPSGYQKADDLRFVTPHTGQKFTVTMTDAVIHGSTGGGGGGEPLHGYQSPIKESEPVTTAPENSGDSDDRDVGRMHVTKILGAGGRRSPETGDTMLLGLWLGVFLLSGGALLGFLIRRKKNGKK